jgi:HlyD family secretion protein
MNKKIFVGIGIVLVLAITFVFVTQRPGATTENAYQTEVVQRGDISTSVGATGTVRAYQSTMLTWQTSGVVEAVNAQLGDAVETDNVLAALEKTSLPQNIIQAEADLISAQQALDNLLGSAETETASAAIALREAQEAYEDALTYRERLNYEVEYEVLASWSRIDTPMGKMKIPIFKTIKYDPTDEQKSEADESLAVRKAEMEDAQRVYERVKNGPNEQDVAAAKARLMAAQATLDQASITSPFNGVVTDIDAQPGNRVAPGELAFRVDNLSNLLIDLEVSEVDINSVSVGQEVIVNFDAIQGKDYLGVVVEIAGTSIKSAGSVKFRVTVELPDADELVKPGMTTSVIIQVREVEDVLLVPNRALRMLDDRNIVYVLRDDKTLEAVEVRLGARAETNSEVVGGGLQAGDLIVLNPPETISNDE